MPRSQQDNKLNARGCTNASQANIFVYLYLVFPLNSLIVEDNENNFFFNNTTYNNSIAITTYNNNIANNTDITYNTIDTYNKYGKYTNCDIVAPLIKTIKLYLHL